HRLSDHARARLEIRIPLSGHQRAGRRAVLRFRHRPGDSRRMNGPRTTAYLVRHGATHDNLEGRFQRYDVPLSEEGEEQARRLSVRLAGLATLPAHVYASDLRRTRQTAAFIAERVPVGVTTTELLRELDAGDWKGMLRAEVDAAWPGALQEWVLAG